MRSTLWAHGHQLAVEELDAFTLEGAERYELVVLGPLEFAAWWEIWVPEFSDHGMTVADSRP